MAHEGYECVEYADAEAAVAEIARILKRRGAVFAAMIHHADSAIVRQAREGIEQILACEKSGLHAAIRDLHSLLPYGGASVNPDSRSSG